MTNKTNSHVASELIRFHDLVLAVIDYYADNQAIFFNAANFDSKQHFEALRAQADDYFKKGGLIKLKQLFHGLSEMQVEAMAFHFNDYLKEKTGHEIDIFKEHISYIELITEKGKISTDIQYYEVNSFIDKLYCDETGNSEKITALSKILSDYRNKRSKAKQRTAISLETKHK